MVVTCLIMIKVIEVIVVKQIIAKMEKIYVYDFQHRCNIRP